jgi:hypothetical protein
MRNEVEWEDDENMSGPTHFNAPPSSQVLSKFDVEHVFALLIN